MLRRAAGSLLRAYHTSRVALLGKTPEWRRVAGDYVMWIDPADWVDRQFYLGLYEHAMVQFIQGRIQPGEVCVDVGAQKGYLTLHMARAVGPQGKVISIEADPRAAAQLRKNIGQNRIQNVTVCDCAAGSENGACEFTLSSQLGWSSRFMNELAKPTALETVRVETSTLDELIESAGIRPDRHRLSFIKIDTEGSEPLVLAGAKRTLSRFQPTLALEINSGSLAAGGFHVSDIVSPLIALGYTICRLQSRRSRALKWQSLLEPISLESLQKQDACTDIIAIPASGSVRG